MAGTRPIRRSHILAALAAAALATALLTAGCGGKEPGPAPGDGPSGVQGIGSSPTASAAASAKPPATPVGNVYPKTARTYAQAVLGAWKDGELDVLADLTTPLVHEQIIEIPGPPNQNWTFHECEEDATTYCGFRNDVGDMIALRIDLDKLGKPHAASDVEFNATIYPADAVDYVEYFIEAWNFANRQRMTRLSNAEITEYVTHFAPPDTYQTCTDGTLGSTYVRVYNAGGLNYTFRVATPLLGGPHAIAERSNIAAACP